jgi:regulator of nucleoside diphosphate kinase
MGNSRAGQLRPQIHLLASESDLVASLALRTEDRNPVVAAMLLEEIERAELHEPATLPKDAVRLGSQVHFVDDKTCQLRKVRIVIPGEANIAENRISILTPMGAALYGLRAGSSIIWPDLDGNERRIMIVRVLQRGGDGPAPRGH